MLLLLSVAGVAAATHVVLPDSAAPQAQEQVDREHPAGDADEDEDSSTEDENTTENEDTELAQGEHGALVSEAARDKTCVGGEHMNHGGAVSQVAQGVLKAEACVAPSPEPATTESTDETDVTTSPGKSGEHRKDKERRANHGSP